MLLQRLVELEGRHESAPAMYQKTPVKWKISLDAKGKLLGVIPLPGDGKKADRGRELLAPTLVRAYAIKPKLLCDNAEYVLGLAREESSPERVAECHRAFVDLVGACASATGEPAVRAVAAFLASWDFSQRSSLPAGLAPGDVMAFEVADDFPMALPSVQRFWAEHTRAAGARSEGEMTCLVCGERKPAERRLPKKIKGVPGGQTAGTAMISANSDAFYSYGLEESLVAPTCRECGERFADALNRLLSDEGSRLYVGQALAYVFWTREAQGPPPFLSFLSEPRPEEVKALLESQWSGKNQSGAVKPADFFAVALSGSGGRVVVRDYVETTVADARENLERWFKLQRLAEDGRSPGKPYGIGALCAALTHDVGKELNPTLPRALVHAAIAGGPLPESILHLAARRNRAEGKVTRPRATLIRMTLVSNPGRYHYKEDDLVRLELENREPAYLCGRLFAELAEAQYAALGPTNTTIVDRYYGTASTAPASVFGVLLRGGQAHLAKLRKENRGAYVNIERRIEEIAAHLRDYPPTLGLHGQALFALGYYHQRAHNRAAAQEKRAQKENAGVDSDA